MANAACSRGRSSTFAEFRESLNCISTSIIETLYCLHPSKWKEITTPYSGDRVCVYLTEGEEAEGEIHGLCWVSESNTTLYNIDLDDGRELLDVPREVFDVVYDDLLPSSEYMFCIKPYSTTSKKLQLTDDVVESLSFRGFRIFRSEEFGDFIGFYQENYKGELDGVIEDLYDAFSAPENDSVCENVERRKAVAMVFACYEENYTISEDNAVTGLRLFDSSEKASKWVRERMLAGVEDGYCCHECERLEELEERVERGRFMLTMRNDATEDYYDICVSKMSVV